MAAPLLDPETETRLARAWRDHRDQRALDQLITAYLRLGKAIAAKFRRYGADSADLLQEAAIGLMKAADRFDPERGVRFSSYASWWIKAAMQDYVMRNHSMVRLGSTAPQKSLFFQMRRIGAQLERQADGALDRDTLHQMIAAELNVPLRDVQMMDGRLNGGDASLNAPMSATEDGGDWMAALADPNVETETSVAEALDAETLTRWLAEALEELNSRESQILRERMLSESPRTLESLGSELYLSKERVRQIEARAMEKLRAIVNKNPRQRAALHAMVAG
jgi:RNA polymerase sigma-32 factor